MRSGLPNARVPLRNDQLTNDVFFMFRYVLILDFVLCCYSVILVTGLTDIELNESSGDDDGDDDDDDDDSEMMHV